MKMKTNLQKISLIISLLGILLLLFLANILEPKLIKIIEIREAGDKMLNKNIKIQGTIFKIQNKENFQILSARDETGQIDILCECEGNSTKINQDIIAIGKVEEYEEYLQISANKIIKVEN